MPFTGSGNTPTTSRHNIKPDAKDDAANAEAILKWKARDTNFLLAEVLTRTSLNRPSPWYQLEVTQVKQMMHPGFMIQDRGSGILD